jgi:hypothetical protein
MKWSALIQGVTTGIVGAAVLGFFVIIRYKARDALFRWRLRRDLRDFGFGWNPHGLTIGIRNWVGKTFTVRSVVVVTDKDHYEAMPTTDVMSTSVEEYPNLTRKERRALERGDSDVLPSTITHGMISLRSWQSNPTADGFATVEPFTQRSFLFHNQLFDDKRGDGTPTALRITIEYEAWPSRRKVMRWDIAKRGPDIAAKFQEMRKQVRDKS